MEESPGVGIHGLTVLSVEEDVLVQINSIPCTARLGIQSNSFHCTRRPRIPDDGPCSCITDSHRIGEYLLHSLIRGKRFALLDAYGSKQASRLRIEQVERFFLNDRIDFFIKLEVICVNRIKLLSRTADEFHFRWVARL